MGGRSFSGGRSDRFSSRVTDEENGERQFQCEYQELPAYVELACSGGLCAAGLNGFKMLEEKGLWTFGIGILWSASVLEMPVPLGMELGSVIKRVNRAKIPRPASSSGSRRGERRIGMLDEGASSNLESDNGICIAFCYHGPRQDLECRGRSWRPIRKTQLTTKREDGMNYALIAETSCGTTRMRSPPLFRHLSGMTAMPGSIYRRIRSFSNAVEKLKLKSKLGASPNLKHREQRATPAWLGNCLVRLRPISAGHVCLGVLGAA